MSTARGLRGWALRNPNEFGLLYNLAATGELPWKHEVGVKQDESGSLVGTILLHATEAGQLQPCTDGASLAVDGPPWNGPDGRPMPAVVRQLTMGAWSELIGHLAVERSRGNLIRDPTAYFEEYLTAITHGMRFTHTTKN